MIKLDASSPSVSVLGEDELQQIVGGYCHRRRRHCGGWGYKRRDWGRCEKKADSYDYDKYEGDSYEAESYEGGDEPANIQVAKVAVTVNIAQDQR